LTTYRESKEEVYVPSIPRPTARVIILDFTKELYDKVRRLIKYFASFFIILIFMLTSSVLATPVSKSQPKSAISNQTSITAIKRGEIAIKGTVFSLNATTKTLVLEVHRITLFGGKPTNLDSPRNKTVLIGKDSLVCKPDGMVQKFSFTGLAKGISVTVVGKNTGVGKSLPARFVIIGSNDATEIHAVKPATQETITKKNSKLNPASPHYVYWEQKKDIPITGIIPDDLKAFDDAVVDIMIRQQIPCGSLTVTRNGKVVINRAYGYKDKERTKPLPTGSLFRIASLDKMVIRTAVDRMIIEGKQIPGTEDPFIRDIKIFRSLQNAGVLGSELKNADPRLFDVTIGQMVDHKSGIAIYYPSMKEVQAFFHTSQLPTDMEILRYLACRKLKDTPGAREEYNNTANGMLWLIIQWINGGMLNTLRHYVYGPADTTEFGVSKTRPKDRNANEVWYSTGRTGASIYSEDNGKMLPMTDGGSQLFDTTMIASSEALARYLSTWYMGTGRPLVDTKGNLAQGNDNGFGVYYGAWDGTWTMMFQRRWTLSNCVLLFNQREERPGVESMDIASPFIVIMEKIGW
jgi:CubicO group peptidase (beta-lactamase class C family)